MASEKQDRQPNACRFCGSVPTVTKSRYSPRLWNWLIICENHDCRAQPRMEAYSWDTRNLAIARWNDQWGQ